jgi:hypothetical protein
MDILARLQQDGTARAIALVKEIGMLRIFYRCEMQ